MKTRIYLIRSTFEAVKLSLGSIKTTHQPWVFSRSWNKNFVQVTKTIFLKIYSIEDRIRKSIHLVELKQTCQQLSKFYCAWNITFFTGALIASASKIY